MKRLAVALLLSCLPLAASAYEMPGNPDRFPSVGFHFQRFDLGGDYSLPTNNSFFFVKGGLGFTQDNFVGDIRFPVTERLTFMLGGGYSDLVLNLRDTTVNNIGGTLYEVNFPTKNSMSGYNLNVGLRYYIH